MHTKSPYRLFPLSFAITGTGILYMLAVFLLSLAVLRTSNNLLFLILATMISAFVISSIVSRNSLKRVSLSIRVPESVYAGDRVPVKISIRNTGRFIPCLSIRVEELGGDTFSSISLKKFLRPKLKTGKKPAAGVPAGFYPSAYFPVLRPGERLSTSTVQTFTRRGRFVFDNLRISTRFPFGLFRHTERVRINGEMVVYPSVWNISDYYQRLPFLPGLLEGRQRGQGENLFSIRPYVDGESARLIDWKATAKTGELMSREFSREEEYRVWLILDTQARQEVEGDYWEAFEKAVSLCASIAAYFIDLGAGLEFLTPYERVPHGTGREHLHRILRLLATVDYTSPAGGTDPSQWIERCFPGIRNGSALKQIASDKAFKIIVTSKNADAFPASIRHASHMVFFNEL